MKRDALFKVYFADEARYADLINGLNFSGRQVVRPEDVQERDGQVVFFRVGFWEKAFGKLQKRGGSIHERDMVRKVVFGTGFAIVGVENQESVDYSIPLRLMLYDVGEYEKQAAKIRRMVRKIRDKRLSPGEFLYRFRREDKLYPVITFLLYYGQEEWQGPRALHDMLDFREIPENIRKMVPDYPVNLVEIRKLTNTEVFRTDIRQVFDFIRCSEDPEQLRQLMENDEAYCALAEDAYDVVTAYTNAEELIEQKEEFREGECVNMCKAIQELMKSSREEGLERGLEQGMERGLERGLEQGLEQGLERQAQKSVVSVLQKKGSLSEEQLVVIQNQKDVDQLERWLDMALDADSVDAFFELLKTIAK